MTVGERIRDARLSRCMTQAELGEYLGISKASINKIEDGSTKTIKPSHIRKLSELFNIRPVLFLLSDDEISEELGNKIQNTLRYTYGEKFANFVSVFESLNEEGKNKLLDYAFDIGSIDKYKK